MDLGALRVLVSTLNFEAHGLPAVVELLAGDVETLGIWLTPITEDYPGALTLTRREPTRVLAIPVADVPDVLPRGTRIRAPLVSGGAVLIWQIDGFERFEAEHARYRLAETS